MSSIITIKLDVERIYEAWREYLLANSCAKYFGMIYDSTKKAKFPYANFKLISRPTSRGDLEGNEASINLTLETEAYINSDKYSKLYEIDTASANFFTELGFRRVGTTELLKVSNTVTKLTSRFSMYNYCGTFLNEINQ